jgi:outer membrane protein assembly complex protein YaeT
VLTGLALLALVPACGHRQQLEDVRGVESYITKVEFVGVHRFKKKELLAYLNIGESSRLPWRPKFAYTEALLPIDAERIVEVYRAHGYYDAEVIAMDTQHKVGRVRLLGRNHNSRRPGKTKIKVTVREGAPTRVRTVDVAWPDGTPVGPPDPKATPQRIARAAQLREGDVFEIPRLNGSREALKAAMQDRGFALAEARESARATPGKGVDVAFELRPGGYFKIGKIAIEGLIGVPEKYVRNELGFAPGKRFSPDLIKRIEQAVYGLSVFESVTVNFAPSETTLHEVDVVVKVVEARTQSIQIGPGLGFDPIRWEERVSLLYSHNNLFKNLTRFDLRTTAGYAELPTLFRPLAHGPLLRVEPRLRQKGFLEKHTTWTLGPSFELGIWEGYQFYSPTLRMGASRFFTRFVQLEVTYNLRFVDFFNVTPALEASESIVGRDFRDPYTLSYIEPALRFYFVDSLLRPRNGAILSLTYDLAGLGGDFSFNKVVPELRAYFTPHERVTFAARASVGFIFPFGRKAGAPFDMKFYLGGADTVRGWGLRRLSPKIYDPDDCEPQVQECGTVPIGGQTMVLANFEARVRTVDQLYVAGFFDMGDVREGVKSFSPRNWSYAAGPGLRYASPIGTFRLDLGFRLNDTDRSIGERGWAIHFGLGETF